MQVRILCFICIAVFMPVLAADNPAVPKKAEVYSMDETFFSNMAADPLLKRDSRINSRLNLLIESDAVVIKVEDKIQYKRKVCIKASCTKNKITLFYNIFSVNEEYKLLLESGSKLSFKGQLAAITPASTRRDVYLLDIILEEGALVVE
jgi:hypothetical protein